MENDLKIWRAKADVTQAELAEEVGVSRQTINASEGGRYDPSVKPAFKLGDYFECRIEDIFHYEPEE